MLQLPFDTVLIANSGEIAACIVKTLRKLGLRSAIAYHELDARTSAASMADLAIQVGGRTPITSYLDTGQIIAAADQARAGAPLPAMGYFRNAEFARAVTIAGVAFAIFAGAATALLSSASDLLTASTTWRA
ncbi:hypothetical protein BSN85_22020 [Bradyrhizobium brasilense]|uniref:biotin carboxylase N-terminal domain-containing protein n=1 Tax=Bradyrhizobium brasilense TaxID=1419277 RepID=UPI000976561C|nr:biotin carboxylase N-terminal domain-containing protein [Bradyrhizobium brasilense]OMI06532.1 hypothetical protein BSN85_22020 [Bradyrhizobium brasilense]